MLWLIIATLGDTPTGILACAGLLLGLLIMARGARGGARERPAPAAPPAATAPVAVAAAVPAPVADDATPEPPATTFRQGAIRLADAPASEQEALGAPDPPPPAAPEPAAPVPPPLSQTPPTTFRQGSIRVGGLERRRD